MQYNLDKVGACSCFQVGDLVFMEELVLELVRKLVQLGQLALLRESNLLEDVMHRVPVRKLAQRLALSLGSSLNVLLAKQLVEHLEADLWVKGKTIAALSPECEEQSRMLGFNITTPGARNMVGHRRLLILRECQDSCPDLQ